MFIVLASDRSEQLAGFSAVFEGKENVSFARCRSGLAALELVRSKEADLVVVDDPLPDFDPLELVSEIIRTRAFTHTVVVSALEEEDFHEKSEGLGILKHLPDPPQADDGEELLRVLHAIA